MTSPRDKRSNAMVRNSGGRMAKKKKKKKKSRLHSGNLDSIRDRSRHEATLKSQRPPNGTSYAEPR